MKFDSRHRPMVFGFVASVFLMVSCSGNQEDIIDPVQAEQMEGSEQEAYEDVDPLQEYQATEEEEAMGASEVTSEDAIQETLGETSDGAGDMMAGESSIGEEIDQLSTPQTADNIAESEYSVPETADSGMAGADMDAPEPMVDDSSAAVDSYADSEAGMASPDTSSDNSYVQTDSSGEYGEYVVQPGDVLGVISQKVMGTAKQWENLANINSIADPTSLKPGDIIKYPLNPRSREFLELAQTLPSEQVEVQVGDSLSRIANRVMGRPDFWKPLWRMNTDTIPDPDRIEVGQTLRYVDPQTLKSAMEQRGWPTFGH